LKNGQLKACYNWQIGTENQFIINYTVHQTSSDMSVFTSHMDDTLELLDSIHVQKPERLSGDAGYGSEENYEYLEEKGIGAFVKYPGYFKENKKNKKRPFAVHTLHYKEEEDCFICPMGQKMTFVRTQKTTTASNYVQTVHTYRAQNCSTCPLRPMCYKAEADRREITVNHRSRNYRKQARKRLDTPIGQELKKKRNIDVEPVFGHIKSNRHFKRFLLKKLDRVGSEIGLLSLAHNLRKWQTNLSKQGGSMPCPTQIQAIMNKNGRKRA